MSYVVPYERQDAVNYALEWAYKRNPRYYDYSNLGGDCTNFISQCLFAGSKIMNYTPTYGWYYRNANDKSPSWTGVNYLYRFLTTNHKLGVFAQETDVSRMDLGDVIQLGDENKEFYHSLLITKIDQSPSPDTIYISTHTIDSNLRPLNTYQYANIRYLHILGVFH